MECVYKTMGELLQMIRDCDTMNPWVTVFDTHGILGYFGRLSMIDDPTLEELELRRLRIMWENRNLIGRRRICHMCMCTVLNWRSHTQTKKHRKNVASLFPDIPIDIKYLITSFAFKTSNPCYYKRQSS